ncbi:MAG: PQQ-binding-like beta-propeller repeat protein [Candidatus Tritonobacter lacicola]|nr:PQQ-binding-like beta-propeller repeat protein [Candidatus Tritonobacter lacicola]
MRRSLLISVFLIFILSVMVQAQEYHPPMRPDPATLREWIRSYEDAPRAYIDPNIKPRRASVDLLSHLQYTPSERNQGYCGNCWAWAGTGCLEIALDFQAGTLDRLSVQYINSCEYGTIGKTCCEGGWLYDFADFYSATRRAVPWSNTNADWQDGDASCDTSCASIATSPYYHIDTIVEETIETHGVGQATAINNIKNVLDQNKAVWFGFFVATESDWDNFTNFWANSGEDVVWNPDFSCNKYADAGGAGHAVLCVGYNDDDPLNSYWVMLNSWGTTTGRPNGLFRLDMNMNYDCQLCAGGWEYSFLWQCLDISFSTPTPTSTGPTPTPSLSPTPAGTSTPTPTWPYFEKDEHPDLRIPDNDPSGVESYLMITSNVRLDGMNVYVDITHDWIGDLIVELRSPASTTVRLHNRTGLSASWTSAWYDRETTPDGPGQMSDFDGESCKGTWRLWVSDNAPNNTGTLNGWGIEIYGGGTALSFPWPMFRRNPEHTGMSNTAGPSSSILKWSYDTGGTVTSSPSVGSDDRVFIGSHDGNLYAINSDGSLGWTYDTGYDIRSSPSLGADSEVYVGSLNPGSFYRLNSNGSLSWSYNADYVRSAPLTGGSDELYFGSNDGNLYAINSDGSLGWTYSSGDYISSSPALGYYGEIYFGSEDHRLYALTPAGGLIWSYVCGDVILSSPSTSTGMDVYAGSDDGNLYSLNYGGALNWSYGTGSSVSSSPAIDENGNIYAGSGDGKLYAVSSSGSMMWSYAAGGTISYSSPAICAERRLYFGSDDNRLYAVNVGGGLRWSYVTGGSVQSSPSISGDGSLIVGSDDGRVYAVYREETARLAIVKREGAGDLNLYYYNSLRPGDMTYDDAKDRNPCPIARDLWVIPSGNDAVGLTATGLMGDTGDELVVLKKEAFADVNLYIYSSLARWDWSYWDAAARNPSPLARDFWIIPSGNDAIGIAAIDITGDSPDELAILKKEGAGDVNLYIYRSPVEGDWSYWDADARNPTALARDFWIIPAGNDAVGLTAIDIDGDNTKELAILKKEGAGDVNLYLYRSPVEGDWTYWDALARNPSPLARDLWIIPAGNDTVAVSAFNVNAGETDSLAILKKTAGGDVNLYYYNCPKAGDWTYWDALARNPSPLARDLWIIPSGNDSAGITAVRME